MTPRKFCFSMALLAGLVGCRSLPEAPAPAVEADMAAPAAEAAAPVVKQADPHDPADAAPVAPAPQENREEIQPQGNFTRHELTELILGELAGQRGDLVDAAQRYRTLAIETRDAAIVRRAAEFSTAIGDDQATLALARLWADLEPREADAHLLLSYHLLRQGDFSRALDALETVMELGARADFTAVSARSAALEAPHHKALHQRLAQLRERFPEEPSLHYALAQMLDQAGEAAEAGLVLQQARERFGETARLLIMEAQLLQNLGRQDEALELLQRGTDRFPRHRLLRYNHAQLLIQSGQLRAARTQFSELLRQAPGDLEALYSLALINMDLGYDREAGAQLEALLGAGHRSNEARYYLGSLAERNGASEQALQWYAGVDRRSGAFIASQRQALALLISAGRYDSAREWSAEVGMQHPDMKALIATLESEALLAAGQEDRAKRLLDETLEQFPSSIDLLFARALLHEREDDMEAVERDLRRIIALEPDNARALNHLGYSLTVNTDRYEEAVVLIERALALQPDDPAIIDSLGWVQFKLGQLEDARHNLERAYALFPNHEVAAHLGEVLWHAGEPEEAMIIWREALEEEPDSEYVHEAMDRLVN